MDGMGWEKGKSAGGAKLCGGMEGQSGPHLQLVSCKNIRKCSVIWTLKCSRLDDIVAHYSEDGASIGASIRPT